ncbi:MAG: hypothetical protein ACPIOQ_09405, partial [Promethearchaeia archaeon]
MPPEKTTILLSFAPRASGILQEVVAVCDEVAISALRHSNLCAIPRGGCRGEAFQPRMSRWLCPKCQLSPSKKKVKPRHLPRLRSHCAAAMRHRGFPRQPARKRGRALLCAVCFFAAILTLWLVSWLYMGYVVAGEHVVEK